MEESWRCKWKVVRKWNVIVWKGDSFSFFCLLALPYCFRRNWPIGVADSVFFPLDHSSTNTAVADTLSLSLHDVDGLRVRNSRHVTSSESFVFGKFVRKPNCSWSEEFVNPVWLYSRSANYCVSQDRWSVTGIQALSQRKTSIGNETRKQATKKFGKCD